MFLILPGKKKIHNELWAKELSVFLSEIFNTNTIVLEHNHWGQDVEEPNKDIDYANLQSLISQNSDIIIIAKSYGTILSLLSLENLQGNCKQMILCGVPANPYETTETDLKNKLVELNNCDFPVTIIQQIDDKTNKSENLKRFIEEVKLDKISLIEIPGFDHIYSDIQEILRTVVVA